MGPEDKICYCYNVPYRKLWHFARRGGLQRASQMSGCLGAGTGCGWCIPILKRIYETAQTPGPQQGDSVQPEITQLTPEEYAAWRQEYIRREEKNTF